MSENNNCRIIAGGCSITYGIGLKDCYKNTDMCSKFAWPSIISDILNIECFNLSKPGASNLEIITQILNFDLKKDDIVVINWSYLTRTPFFNDSHVNRLGEWDNEYLKYMNTFSNNNDIIIKNLIHIYLFTKYLESKEVFIYYSFVDELNKNDVYPLYIELYDRYMQDIKKYDITNKTWNLVLYECGINKVSLGLDKLHPNEEFNERFGFRFYLEILRNEKIRKLLKIKNKTNMSKIKLPNLFPEYYKNGKELIKQHLPDKSKGGDFNFYLSDSEDEYKKNLITQPDDWYYKTNNVIYKINSLGYRTKEINEIDWKNSIIILGCSFVFGVGITEEDTLSYKLSKLYNRDVINLGISGVSNQFMLDLSLSIIKNYGIPYGVIMCWTSTARFPYYSYERVEHVGSWRVNEKNNFMSKNANKYSTIYENLYSEKSHELITYKNIIDSSRSIWKDKTNYFEFSNFIESAHYGELEYYFDYSKTARDLIHPGRDDNEYNSKLIYENFKI